MIPVGQILLKDYDHVKLVSTQEKNPLLSADHENGPMGQAGHLWIDDGHFYSSTIVMSHQVTLTTLWIT